MEVPGPAKEPEDPQKPAQKTAEVPVKPEPAAPSKPWTKVADMFLMALRLNREPWQVVAQSLARDVEECKSRLAYLKKNKVFTCQKEEVFND